MPDVEEIPERWREKHLARQREVFTRYPEDMGARGVRDVPAGLDGAGRRAEPKAALGEDAAAVADETVGRRPESALRDRPRPTGDQAAAHSPSDAGRRERVPERRYDGGLFLVDEGADLPADREYDGRLFKPEP